MGSKSSKNSGKQKKESETNVQNSLKKKTKSGRINLGCIKKRRSKKRAKNDLDSNVCINSNPSPSSAENCTYIPDYYENSTEPVSPQEFESDQIEPEIISTSFMSKSEEVDTNLADHIEANITIEVSQEAKLTENSNIKDILLQWRREFFNQDSSSNLISKTHISEDLIETKSYVTHSIRPLTNLTENTSKIHNNEFDIATENDSAIDSSLSSKSLNVPEPIREMIMQEETESDDKNSSNSFEIHSKTNKFEDYHIDENYKNVESEEIKCELEIKVPVDKYINSGKCKNTVQTNMSTHNHTENENCQNNLIKNKREVETNTCADNHMKSENWNNYDIKDNNEMNIFTDNNIKGKNCKINDIGGKGIEEVNVSAHNHIESENGNSKDKDEVEMNISAYNNIESENFDFKNDKGQVETAMCADNHIESENCENGNSNDKDEVETNMSAHNLIESENCDIKNDKGLVEITVCADNLIDNKNSQTYDIQDNKGEIETNISTDKYIESNNFEKVDSKDCESGGEMNISANENPEIEDIQGNSKQCGAGVVDSETERLPESDSESMQSWEPQGFSNPFGYFYLNSLVQSLASCEEFRNAMISYKPGHHNNHRDLTFVLGLCSLIRGLKNKDKYEVSEALDTIQSHCDESAFGDDIFKCFMNVLSRISNVIGYNNQEIPNSSEENIDKAEISFRKHKNKNQEFVFDNFYGQLVFQTVCKHCNHVINESFQLMKSLPLPIPSSSTTVTLDMCIKEFFMESDIDSDIPMSCRCENGYTDDLELCTKITHTPRYLFMYLNRWSYDREMKNETYVECGSQISIETFRGEIFQYNLISVIDHIETNGYGHCYCKCCYDGETWWCLDDFNVQRMSRSDVVCRDSIGFIFKKDE